MPEYTKLDNKVTICKCCMIKKLLPKIDSYCSCHTFACDQTEQGCCDTGLCVACRTLQLTHFCPPLRFRNICCPRDCVSRHNGGTSGAPLKPLRDDSALSSDTPFG